jgi:hypothetical protein
VDDRVRSPEQTLASTTDLVVLVRQLHLRGRCSRWCPFLTALRVNAWSLTGGIALKGILAENGRCDYTAIEIDGSNLMTESLASAEDVKQWISSRMPDRSAFTPAKLDEAIPNR